LGLFWKERSPSQWIVTVAYFRKKAFEHQVMALDWADIRSKVIFFMEMRLGKTLVAIRWAEQFFLQKILVLAPRPVLTTWQDELAAEGISSTVLRGTFTEVRTAIQQPMTRWCLANYEAQYHLVENEAGKKKLRPILSQIAQASWDAVIFDESTSVRNPQAIRTKACKRAFKDVEYKAALSGLPNPESFLDFFEQFAMVYGDFAGCKDYWHFRYHYFNQYGYEWVLKPGAREQLKQLMAGQAFFLQRADVRDCLEKVFERRMVDLPEKQREVYGALERDWMFGEQSTKHRIVVDVWLNRLASGSAADLNYTSKHKLEELLNLLQNELQGKQVVVWSVYNQQVASIVVALEKAGIKACSMTGEDSPAVQENVRIEFRKKSFQVLVCQIKLGKYGLDFSNASAAIYMSNGWEFELRAQSEDRVINPNKNFPSLIVDIITEDTIEEDIYRALKKKAHNARTFNADVTAFTITRLRRKYGNKTRTIETREVRTKEAKNYLRKIGVLSSIGS
jgi:superfamily II DNA or RNA helicase